MKLRILASFLALVTAEISAAPASPLLQNFYNLNHVVKIEISMNQWDNLKNQDPVGGICNFDYIGSRYEWMHAEEVKVDGQTLADVGIKKRSWCGSFSRDKPALALKFDKYQNANKKLALDWFGVDNLVLNNSVQDPSYVRQCFAYQIFAAASVAAPLCNFARLSVNGQDFGMYVNIQPYKKSFFEQQFGKPVGNSYEVEWGDFRESSLDRFAQNLDAMGGDSSLTDIKNFIGALNQADAGNWEPMLQQWDVDQFMRFWAIETLLVHWDGLTWTTNNSYAYFQSDGRLRFLPWGTDQILSRDNEAYQDLNRNRLAAKLYETDYFRKVLHNNVTSALNSFWNEPQLIARVDAMADIVQWQLPEWSRESLWSAVESLRQRIYMRRWQLGTYIEPVNTQGRWVDPGNRDTSFPLCQSAESDPDLDSWGWENGAVCKVM